MAQEQLEFYYDEDDTPRARGEDDRLACYFETDLQGSSEVTSELIAKLQDADFRGDFNGNGHSVDIRENSVLIDSNFDDETPSRVLSRDEFLQSVQAWLAFIDSTNNSGVTPPPA